MEIIWLSAGDRTRDAQIDHVANDKRSAAARLDAEIERQVDQLADHPQMGRPGRRPGTRELVIGRTPFIAVYRVARTRIEIIRILHGAQQWAPDRRVAH